MQQGRQQRIIRQCALLLMVLAFFQVLGAAGKQSASVRITVVVPPALTAMAPAESHNVAAAQQLAQVSVQRLAPGESTDISNLLCFTSNAAQGYQVSVLSSEEATQAEDNTVRLEVKQAGSDTYESLSTKDSLSVTPDDKCGQDDGMQFRLTRNSAPAMSALPSSMTTSQNRLLVSILKPQQIQFVFIMSLSE